MPQLDGTSILAFASFAVLVVAWLIAPNTTAVEARQEPYPAAA